MLQVTKARQTEKYTTYALRVDDGTFNSTAREKLETLLQVMESHNWTAYYQLDEMTKTRLAMRGIGFIQGTTA